MKEGGRITHLNETCRDSQAGKERSTIPFSPILAPVAPFVALGVCAENIWRVTPKGGGGFRGDGMNLKSESKKTI